MNKAAIIKELVFKAIRSSGAGGQHVNKVASKVVVSFHIDASDGLTVNEKERLIQKLESKLNKDGLLVMRCEESRSQFRNKALVTERLLDYLAKNLIRPTKRKATKPSYGSVQRKLKNKAIQSEKKNRRKPPKQD